MLTKLGNSCIRTFTGLAFDYLDPKPSMICIEDIAHALSMVCRFAGQSREFYSVAQHSILVCEILPPCLGCEALLHDASEAYMGDMARPLKRHLPDYKQIEAGIMEAIAKKYDLPRLHDPEIKKADNIALAFEADLLMKGRVEEYGAIPDDTSIGVRKMAENVLSFSVSPKEAEKWFLREWEGQRP